MQANIIIYSKPHCPYCDRAKELLDRKGAVYQVIRVDTDDHQREEMERLSGRRTVPQIFIDNNHIGGFDDLLALEKAGKLNTLLHLDKEK